MEWSEEEIKALVATGYDAQQNDGWIAGAAATAIATRAVKLAAARGGTMTEAQLSLGYALLDNAGKRAIAADFREHITALGARNAVLEAERDEWKRRSDSLLRQAETLETEEAPIRRRSLDAGNLERLIAEHGFNVTAVLSPAGLRYPCSATCTHDDAANPGHQERVKSLGEESFKSELEHEADNPDAFAAGAEAMRAACWEACQTWLQQRGCDDTGMWWKTLKAAIEGATP